MLITDLFSHKIHSSGDDWPEKLIDIATIFNKFDGQPYDRLAIELELLKISPRATKVARDASKFRDEISAYPAYLGLYRLENLSGVWHIFMSKTAKRFLVNEEPNVAAFLLLQLALFQYPNGMGVAYTSGGSGLRIQANTKNRTLSFIHNEIHLSPLRLICKIIIADSIIRDIDVFEAEASFNEIFLCANDKRINIDSSPELSTVVHVLNGYRKEKVLFSDKFESRFHILKHTGLFEVYRDRIKLKKPTINSEKNIILERLNALNEIKNQFIGFDKISDENELIEVLRSCSWSNYFDGIKTLDQESVYKLTRDNNEKISSNSDVIESKDKLLVISSDTLYELKEYGRSVVSAKKTHSVPMYVDPELTKIRRQKANLTHKILLDKLSEYLVKKGATTFENEHIDLYVNFDDKEKFLFEVKSIDDANLLSQTRKGISQLYEYRYRYQNIIGYDAQLFLVFPFEPKSVPWLQRYLCEDRMVNVIWFEDDEPQFSKYCNNISSVFKTNS